MIIFVCERTLERVPYDGEDVFTVPIGNVRDALRAALRFWKKYGPIVKFSATTLAALVKATSISRL